MYLATYIFGDDDSTELFKKIQPMSKLGNINVMERIVLEQNKLSENTNVDITSLRAHIGRSPLLGEIACALGHLKIYKAFSDLNLDWALVFEEDANIIDIDCLVKHAQAVLSFNITAPSIISLYSEYPYINRYCKNKFRKSEFVKIPFAPWNTVAYFINKSAANLFINSQEPLKYLADWPYVSSKEICFFVVETHLIMHGNSDRVSTIDSTRGLRIVNTSNRFAIWTGLWYFKNRKTFTNIKEYFYILLLPRIRFHYDQIMTKINL